MGVTVASDGQSLTVGLEGGLQQVLKIGVVKKIGDHKDGDGIIVGRHPSVKSRPTRFETGGHSGHITFKRFDAPCWMTLVAGQVAKVIGVHGEPSVHADSPRPKSMRWRAWGTVRPLNSIPMNSSNRSPPQREHVALAVASPASLCG